MAKFIKSIFTPENKKHFDDELEGDTDPPPLDSRRKLSMSRSGRLKHSYKKRQQLSVEVYGGDDMNLQASGRPKSLEYHVNTPTSTPATPNIDSRQNKIEPKTESSVSNVTETATKLDKQISKCQSPDEEIDNAFNFDVIDKS